MEINGCNGCACVCARYRIRSLFICPGRGLRQGDPLSPYLFILCDEGLSSLINEKNRRGILHGSRACRRGPAVSHLLFANNGLLFCRATSHECTELKSTLDLYERASGQAINFGKSEIFFSKNVSPERREEVKTILGVAANLNTGRYLGVPSFIGLGKVAIFQYVRDWLWDKLKNWRNKKISEAGKEVLIKSAAHSIPAYCMRTFLLPPTLLDELQKIVEVVRMIVEGSYGLLLLLLQMVQLMCSFGIMIVREYILTSWIVTWCMIAGQVMINFGTSCGSSKYRIKSFFWRLSKGYIAARRSW